MFDVICADTKRILVDALPLALMTYHMQTNSNMYLTPHEMLMGRPMSVSVPYDGRPLE